MNEIHKNKALIVVAICALLVGYVVGGSRLGNVMAYAPAGYSYGDSQQAEGGMMHGGMMGKRDGRSGESESMDMMMRMMTMNLQGKTGDAFDKAFLADMIPHHEGAVVMAEMVLKTSQRSELLQLAQDIITAQNKEIEMMKGWQKNWFTVQQ